MTESEERAVIDKTKKLGRGTFGRVFQATYKGIQIAVKKMDLVDSKSFNKEIAVLKNCMHRNIITYFGYYVDKNEEYNIMLELCQYTVKDFIAETRKGKAQCFSGLTREQLFFETASGLAYLHEKNIVHRDIKPSNILLKEIAPTVLQVKVTDFGISKCLDSASSSMESGTWGYRAAEVVNGQRPGKKSDIFSLAIVFYEVVRGVHPFGENSLDQQVQIRDKKPFQHLQSSTDDPMVKTINRMLAHEIESRPTAVEVRVTAELGVNVTSQTSVHIPAAGEPSDYDELISPTTLYIDRPSLRASRRRNNGEMSRQASKRRRQSSSKSAADTLLSAGARAHNTTASPTAIFRNVGLDAAVGNPSQKECEKAEALIKDSKFEEAVSILEDLPPSQSQQLLLIDCYSQLRRDSQLVTCIETMHMLMTRHPRPDADDVCNLGVKNVKSRAHIRALTYFSCASKLYKLDHTTDPNHALNDILFCSVTCCHVMQRMTGLGGRMYQLAKKFGIHVITQILADYRSVPDGDPDVKIEYECHGLNQIGLCYYFTKQHQKSIERFQLGIGTMKAHFGEKASSFHVLGLLLHSLGDAEFDQGNYIEAEKCFSEALKAKELAENFVCEDDKKESIQRSIYSLKDVRKQMGKTSA